MNKNLFSFILPVFLISNTNVAQEATEAHKDSINTILTKYYNLNLKMFQEGSTVEDVDNAFNLFTDDFTYTHSKFNGFYTRESLYKSALRNLNEGNYDGRVTDFKIESKIIGLKAAAVQKRFVEKKGGVIVESELQMTLFEFRDGKISRIVEYW
ncbi:nuclear transport factor 2 family protein [Pontimicrobium aquaticum]|uniref:Nuclear transport factor 2 family protein n=1 Tax=Pontimicrobium aquaticum TaxID=2565367 RepID=A0A4U0ES69_9FLAO|nr:nuclear transport factor 2 family protein [Pontimicrobium aquaticum]TJY34587.1 nuclear transport factor 2 family protein [Pontimicrobium aquaticum]